MPLPISRLFIPLLLSFLSSSSCAVQLSELLGSRTFIVPLTFHRLSKTTALISASPGFLSYDRLNLHPIVSVHEPRGGTTTLLLAHIYFKNQTVIWAYAVTTFGTRSKGVSIDNEGCIIVVGTGARVEGVGPAPKGSFSIIKFSSAGSRIWETIYSPRIVDSDPLFVLEGFDISLSLSVLVYASNSELVVTAEKRRPLRNPKVYIVFNASNGRLLRIVKPVFPSGTGFVDPTNVAVTSTPQGPLACFAFSSTKGTFRRNTGLFVSCTQTGPRKSSVNHTLEDFNDDLYHLNTADIQLPGKIYLFFVSERVGRSDMSRTKRSHNMFI